MNQRTGNIVRVLFIAVFCLVSVDAGAVEQSEAKVKFLVVSSYHKGYNWSTDTNEGFCAAMLQLQYFENKKQAARYSADDFIETPKAIVKKTWLNAKRKKSKEELERSALEIMAVFKEFKPSLVFLGDDDAAQHVGTMLLDADVPVVVWGIDNTPEKYGLIDDAEKPGHNVTGVYQTGYYEESMQLLKTIVPGVRNFAILSDDSSTGRSKLKGVEYVLHKGSLPFQLVETVATNDYEVWKQKALELQDKVDAFYMAMWSSLKDKDGNYVPTDEVARWYLEHIRIPETTGGGHFVKQGLLCSADDAGYNQGFEAVLIAHDIVTKGANPATYPTRTPRHGKLIANRQRASMLGIALTPAMGIEEIVEEAGSQQGMGQ